MSSRAFAGLVVLSLLTAAAVAGCKQENKFVAPPPAEVSVAHPLKRTFTPYLEQTGNTQAFNAVDLVARVEGFVTAINYKDGEFVKKGTVLFEIDPTTYVAKLKQAQADLASAKAQLVVTQADYERQATLLKQSVTAQTTFDQARAKRDSASANVESQTANVAVAQENLNYTKVVAPFDGIVTKHLVSVGELVGAGTATKLATVVQLDPIYAQFNMSEQDVLSIRAGMGNRRPTREELATVPLDIGLMNEQGYPHQGRLDYVSPELDTATGTILLRGLFPNANRDLLPGFFVRVRVPRGDEQKEALVVPDRTIAEDQTGRYLLVVNKDNVVEQRRVVPGQLLVGNLRVIEKGLTADDQVVVSTNGQAIAGNKVVPKLVTIAAPADASAAPPAQK
ncbi:MAG TPA: efflux RND transporter periplasmic adaptor subunit [Reyranella sp.]|jgi:RND family efflux transporter MFP subunit|nr:efflux RND transporter periplasmic adaptor subunit [Reyranella sp.]